jgi:hypothetical protein
MFFWKLPPQFIFIWYFKFIHFLLLKLTVILTSQYTFIPYQHISISFTFLPQYVFHFLILVLRAKMMINFKQTASN